MIKHLLKNLIQSVIITTVIILCICSIFYFGANFTPDIYGIVFCFMIGVFAIFMYLNSYSIIFSELRSIHDDEILYMTHAIHFFGKSRGYIAIGRNKITYVGGSNDSVIFFLKDINSIKTFKFLGLIEGLEVIHNGKIDKFITDKKVFELLKTLMP